MHLFKSFIEGILTFLIFETNATIKVSQNKIIDASKFFTKINKKAINLIMRSFPKDVPNILDFFKEIFNKTNRPNFLRITCKFL